MFVPDGVSCSGNKEVFDKEPYFSDVEEEEEEVTSERGGWWLVVGVSVLAVGFVVPCNFVSMYEYVVCMYD